MLVETFNVFVCITPAVIVRLRIKNAFVCNVSSNQSKGLEDMLASVP